MPGRRANSWRANGFTLIEVLVVTGLIALIVSFAIPVLASSTRSGTLDVGAEQLLADLRFAQMLAVSENQTVPLVVVDVVTYRVAQQDRVLTGGLAFGSSPDSIAFSPHGPVQTGPTTLVLTLVQDAKSANPQPWGSETRMIDLSGAGHARIR